jgi:hypothetical protein
MCVQIMAPAPTTKLRSGFDAPVAVRIWVSSRLPSTQIGTHRRLQLPNSGKLVGRQGIFTIRVAPILPQLVGQTDSESGTLTMDYVSLVPVPVKAIQEQQDILKRQQETLNHQQTALHHKDNEIAALSARLTALEQMMEWLAEPHMAKPQK